MLLMLALMFLITSLDGQPSQNDVWRDQQPFLYIYEDLSANLKDTWPPANMSGKSVNNSIFRQSMRENRGYGTLIDPSCGMYNTWQFSVFKAIHQRLLVSPMRTLDPSKASVFFLPYDGGVDALVSSYDGRLIKFKCPRSGPAKMFLSGQEYFKRNSGRDHFLVFSVIQGVSSLNSPGCKGLYKDVCEHCTKLTIEVSYHADTTNTTPSFANLSAVFIDPKWPEWKKKNRERKALGLTGESKKSSAYTYDPTWVSIPYPSSFHYFDGILDIPWKYRANSTRNVTAVFVGGGKTTNLQAKLLRERLRRQCEPRANCEWIATGKDRAHVNLSTALSMYRNSVFCLNPPGDSPTRKGLFDSLLAGCIPVVFDKYTLEDQYAWHVGADRFDSISVYIPIEDMIGNITSGNAEGSFLLKKRKKHRKFDDFAVVSNLTNFMDHLEKITPGRIKEMQQSISRIANSLQYSIPPSSASEEKRWQPPFRDSVDVIIEKMLMKVNSIASSSINM